jgi:hypothetical protein
LCSRETRFEDSNRTPDQIPVGTDEYGMSEHLRSFPWVLELVLYANKEQICGVAVSEVCLVSFLLATLDVLGSSFLNGLTHHGSRAR